MGHQFAGALCHADDIVLLAPCASALCQMLSICNSYATSHDLVFKSTIDLFLSAADRHLKPSPDNSL